MQIRTGIDIIEVDRIEDAIEKQGEKFLNKIYTKTEIGYCSNKGKMTYQHFAARFAAKEAIFKAISDKVDLQEGDIWNKIEITNQESGKPVANLEKLHIDNIKSMDLSISHIKEYATASFSILFNE